MLQWAQWLPNSWELHTGLPCSAHVTWYSPFEPMPWWIPQDVATIIASKFDSTEFKAQNWIIGAWRGANVTHLGSKFREVCLQIIWKILCPFLEHPVHSFHGQFCAQRTCLSSNVMGWFVCLALSKNWRKEGTKNMKSRSKSNKDLSKLDQIGSRRRKWWNESWIKMMNNCKWMKAELEGATKFQSWTTSWVSWKME